MSRRIAVTDHPIDPALAGRWSPRAFADRAVEDNTLSSLLEAAGFVVDRTYLSGFPFFNLYRCVVIARGDRLAEDVAVGYQGKSAYLAGIVMTMFRGLFRFNMFNSPFGWQVVAVARKSGS